MCSTPSNAELFYGALWLLYIVVHRWCNILILKQTTRRDRASVPMTRCKDIHSATRGSAAAAVEFRILLACLWGLPR